MVDHDDTERPSKSQRKRDMLALQALGERLVGLPAAQLTQMDLPQALHDAIMHARGITARGGRKRQLQYIGKLMRSVDAGPIREALARIDGTDHAQRARLHQAERWRERLLAEGDAALAELLDAHPGADHEALSQLLRAAQQELEQGGPPKQQRALFRVLRALPDDTG